VFPRTAVWLRYAGSPAFVADASLATIYNPGQEYTRDVISRDGDRCEWFGVSPGVALEIASALDPRAFDNHEQPFRARSAPVDRSLYLTQRAFFTQLEDEAVPEMEAEETIIALVSAVMRRAYGHRPHDRRDKAHRDLVERAKASLSRNIREQHRLSELARELAVSPFHLCRVFRERTGTTLHEFKTELRVRRALEFLGNPSAEISRIAYECGFSSHSHFTSAMRARFGSTPSALRSSLRRFPAAAERGERSAYRSRRNSNEDRFSRS
jgi:AraC-like DNA-binding protein